MPGPESRMASCTHEMWGDGKAGAWWSRWVRPLGRRDWWIGGATSSLRTIVRTTH